MRNYEIMIIVKPTLNEDETKAVVEKFSSVLTDNEAKIVEAKEIGQRELAYEIKNSKVGIIIYILLKLIMTKQLKNLIV